MTSIIKNIFSLIFAYRDVKVKGKNPLYSKTFWGLIATFIATMLAKYGGIEMDGNTQAAVVMVAGFALRMISHGSVGFYEDKTP